MTASATLALLGINASKAGPKKKRKAAKPPERRAKQRLQVDGFPVLGCPEKPSADDKLAVLQFYNSLKRKKPISMIVKMISGGCGVKLSKSSLMDWQRRFKTGGVAALVDKRGGNNRSADDLIIKDVLKAHSAAMHDTNLYEMYKLRWFQRNLNQDYDNITYYGFIGAKKRILKNHESIRILHTRGLDALMSNVHTTRRRDITRINQEWQIDATKQDMMVLAPLVVEETHPGFAAGIPYLDWHTYKFGEHLDWGLWTNHYRVVYQARRKTVVAITDVYSGRRVWGLFDTANSYADVRLMVKAIKSMGKPHVLRIDNGKDYLSKHFMGVLSNLGILSKKARPYKGKDKGSVERNFRTMQHGRMQLLSGFAGHNVTERQLLEASAVTKAQRLNGVQTHLNDLYTEEEAAIVIDRFIEIESKRLGWQAKWDEQAEAAPHLIEQIPPDILEISAGKRKLCRVGRTGITYKKAEYDHPELYKHQDTKVLVAENIDDISSVFVVKPDSEDWICQAYDTRVRHFTAEEYRKIEKLHTAKYRALRKAAETVRLEDAALVEEAFLGDVLDAERKRKDDLLKTAERSRGFQKGSGQMTVEKGAGNLLLLKRAEESYEDDRRVFHNS